MIPSLFQYVLNDKVSYPEGTFMDWEFKISVMYDIAKVRSGSAENRSNCVFELLVFTDVSHAGPRVTEQRSSITQIGLDLNTLIDFFCIIYIMFKTLKKYILKY